MTLLLNGILLTSLYGPVNINEWNHENSGTNINITFLTPGLVPSRLEQAFLCLPSMKSETFGVVDTVEKLKR